MDIIKFEFIEHELKKDVDYVNTIGLNVLFNDECMKDVVDIVSILASYPTNNAEFTIYTCSCGVPECAGFNEYVVHKKEKNTITWILPEEDKYSFSKKNFVFDKQQFENEVKRLMKQITEFEEKEIYLEQHVGRIAPYYAYDKNISENQLKDLKRVKFKDVIKSAHNYYANKEKLKVIIQKKFPKYVNKKINFIYDGKQSTIDYDLESLIGRTIYEFPNYKNDKGYLTRVQLAGQEIIKFIKNEENELELLLKNSYDKTSSFLPYDFCKKIENDDIEDDEDFNLDMALLKFNITE